MTISRKLPLFLFASTLIAGVGCNRQPDVVRADDQVQNDVQTKFASDNVLQGQAIDPTAHNGVVTLSGTVSTDAARDQAGIDAGQVPGVKTVVNNVVVPADQTTQAVACTPPPTRVHVRVHRRHREALAASVALPSMAPPPPPDQVQAPEPIAPRAPVVMTYVRPAPVVVAVPRPIIVGRPLFYGYGYRPYGDYRPYGAWRPGVSGFYGRRR